MGNINKKIFIEIKQLREIMSTIKQNCNSVDKRTAYTQLLRTKVITNIYISECLGAKYYLVVRDYDYNHNILYVQNFLDDYLHFPVPGAIGMPEAEYYQMEKLYNKTILLPSINNRSCCQIYF